MTSRMWKISGVITAVFIIAGIIDFRLATGFILGAGAAVFLYYRNHVFWNDVVDTNMVKSTTGLLHFVINYAIMGMTLILPALLPQYLNIFTAAAGLLLIKWTVYIDAVLPRKEN